MSQSSNKTLLGTSILLAITSSLCCIAPLLTIIGGVSGAASSLSWVAPLRPYIIGVTILVLGFAFYNAYKPKPKEEDCCKPEKKNFMQSKGFLWTITIISALLITFPYYANVFYSKQDHVVSNVNPENIQSVKLTIEGMSCKDCENHINTSALKQTGVIESQTWYEKGEAEVKFDRTKNTTEEIASSIEKETGYKVKQQ